MILFEMTRRSSVLVPVPSPKAAAVPNGAMRPTLSAPGAETREQLLLEALAEAEGRVRLCERQLIEFNHRIANTLQIVSGLIEARSIRMADPVAKEVLDTVAARVQAIALLHSHLCRHSRTARVDLGRLLAEMASVIEGAIGVRCEVDTEPTEVPGQTALHLAIAVNEFVLNARKHAYGRPGRRGSQSCLPARPGRVPAPFRGRLRRRPAGRLRPTPHRGPWSGHRPRHRAATWRRASRGERRGRVLHAAAATPLRCGRENRTSAERPDVAIADP